MITDPIEILLDLGITVAWAREMRWRALWLPDEKVVVLNASIPRQELAAEVRRLLPSL